MDWLEVIQTVGICLNSILLLAITLMIFRVGTEFLPPSSLEIEEMLNNLDNDDELPTVFYGKSREEVKSILTTPVPPSSKKRRNKKK